MRNIMMPSTLMNEVMAHPFYPLEEEVGFDQQSKQDTLLLSHSIRNDPQQELVERGNGCISPPELDGKMRNSTRRRIPVACNRCRKRKIKCSGDIGDGQGCSNCRTSGNTNCQFLRVNSSIMQPKITGWPYPTMSAVMIPQPQRSGLYAPPMTTKSGIVQGDPSNLRFASHSRPSSYAIGSLDPQNSYIRQSFSIDHAPNYDDESSTAYSTQPSAYMLTSMNQGGMADFCGYAWNSKAWNPSIQANKTASGALFPDPDVESPLTQASYSYLFPGQGTQSTEIPSVAPKMTCMSSEEQSVDRTLPNPTVRSQAQMDVSSLATPPEAISGLPLSQDYRVGPHWTSRTAIANSNRADMHPSPNGALGASPLTRTKREPSDAEEMIYEFLPLTSTGPSPHLISSDGTYTATYATLDMVDSTNNFRANTEARLTRSFSRDNGRILSLTDYTSDVYGYSSSGKRKNRSEAGDPGSPATLMNGLPYTRPRHTDSHNSFFNLLSTDNLPDYRASTEVHRTPVSALRDPDGF